MRGREAEHMRQLRLQNRIQPDAITSWFSRAIASQRDAIAVGLDALAQRIKVNDPHPPSTPTPRPKE
jgi:hypothetical protein